MTDSRHYELIKLADRAAWIEEIERMKRERLSFDEWRGIWACRLRYWLCKLRGGHKWGPWGYEEPMYSYGASHSCVRCEHWERDEATW